MQLLYGTFNPAKLQSMRGYLEQLPLDLLGLFDLDHPPGDVEEAGGTPLENARLKAIAYRDATGMTTLSSDSALYLQGLADDLQPGVHARRTQGKRMTDDEMIEYYASLVRSVGGRATAQYRNALCIAFADGTVAECCDDTIASRPFYLVDRPHAKRVEGFPLDSLSVEIQSGRYYFDLQPSFWLEADVPYRVGYQQFVRKALGLDA